MCSSDLSRADVAIQESYVIINNGSGNYYYEGKDNGGTNTPFSTINATVNLLASPTLTLNGGQTKTVASGGDYQNSSNYERLYYRFYNSTGTPGAYSTISESFLASQPAYPNYTWETSNSNINLISGKDSGTYYLDVYWDGNGSWWNGSSQQYYTSAANAYGSSGSPIRAIYSLFYGATTTGTQPSAFTGTGYFNFNGSGQTYTLNAANTYTGQTQIDAGTVSITSTGSLSSSSMVYLGNGGNSSNAGLTLAGTTTFGNTLQVNQNNGSGTRTITKSDATSQTMSGTITLNQLTSFDVASGGTLTLSGVVGGTNSFTKIGSGTMILSGSSANTFNSGSVTVSAGTLVLNKSANTSAIAGRPVDIASGATMRTDAAGQIGSAPLVTVTGTFDLNGNSQTVALAGGGSVKLDGTSTSGTLTISNSGTDTFSGTISDNARTDGAVTKSGTGMQILTGNNAYDGATTVSAGVLRIGHANGLGSTTGGTAVSSGAALELSNNIAVGAETLTLSGDGISYGGSLRNVNGNNSWAGSITNSSMARINSDAGTLTISGNITNAASQSLYFGGAGNVTVDGTITGNLTTGNGAVYKDGAGNLTLSANNSGLTGTFKMLGGTITITNANSLGSGSIEFGSGGTLTTLQVNSNATIANRFEVANNATNAVINVASNTTNTISGILSQTNGTVNTTKIGKDGAGTLILNNSGGTYNGQIQIGNGAVILGANNALGVNYDTTSARGVDLGLNVGDVAQANNVSLLASNGVTVGQSIWVEQNTSGATRTVGISGSGTATFTNEVRMNTGTTLTVQAGSSATDRVNISGVISQNSGAASGISKQGAGTLALSGANSYIGTTTINAGTLKLERLSGGVGATSVSGSTIAVNSGGTLLLGQANQIGDTTGITMSGGTLNTGGLQDAVGKLTVSANSTIQGMNSTSGSAFTFSDIDLGNYSTSGGSTLTFLNSSGTSYAQGTIIQLSTLAASSWTGYTTTSLNNFADKISFSDANLRAQINFGGGTSGTTLTVAAIPEPKVYAAAVVLLALIGWTEVRRRRLRAKSA